MGDLIGTYFMIYLLLYFLPLIVALLCGSNRVDSVFLMNLFLGWTFIGWIWAFIWAISPRKEQQNIIINNHLSADRTINPIISQPINDNIQEFSNIETLPKKQLQIEISTIKSHQEKISQLQQLKQLLDSGILTQEEFEQQKNQILAS